MCYKDKVQRDNAEKLQRKFDQDNTPRFIQKYFMLLISLILLTTLENRLQDSIELE